MIDAKSIPFELDMLNVPKDSLAITVVYEYPYGIRYRITYKFYEIEREDRGRYLLEKVEHI